jgi:hypothetical protein
VERLDLDVSSIQAALEKTPEVFNSVGMDLAANIFNGMVDYLVLKIGALVAAPFIRYQG